MGKLIVSAFIFLTASFALNAFAAETETANIGGGSSTMSQSDFGGGLMKSVYADFLTTYHGPTLQKFGPYSQTGRGGKVDPTALTGFDNEANIAWKLDGTGNVGVGPVIPFQWQPNLRDHQFVMGNAGVKWFNKTTVKTDNLQIATNFYLQAPTSDDSHQRNMNFEVQTEPWIMYNLPNSKVRLGSWSTIGYMNGVTDGLAFKVYVEPYVMYRLTDNFAFNLSYETEADHFIGQRPLHFENTGSDFQPGFVWNIVPGTKLNPYLLMFPADHLSTAVTGVGMVFYSQIL